MVQHDCLRDAFCDVNLGFDAVQAGIALVRLHGNAAHAATDHGLLHVDIDGAARANSAGGFGRLTLDLFRLWVFDNLRLEEDVRLVLRQVLVGSHH